MDCTDRVATVETAQHIDLDPPRYRMPNTPSLTGLPTELRFTILGYVLEDLGDRIAVTCCGKHLDETYDRAYIWPIEFEIEQRYRRMIVKLKAATTLFKVNKSLRDDAEAFLANRVELSFCTKHASDTIMWPERCQGAIHQHSMQAISSPFVTSCSMSSYARWASKINIRVDIGGTVFDYEIEELYRRALVDDMRSLVQNMNEQPQNKKLKVKVLMRGTGKHFIFDDERLAEHLSVYEQLDDRIDLAISVLARCEPRHKLAFKPYLTDTVNRKYLEQLQSRERSKQFVRICWLLDDWIKLRAWVDAEFDFDNLLGRVWLRYSRPSRQVDEEIKPRLIGFLINAWDAHHHGKPDEFSDAQDQISKLLSEHQSNRLQDIERKLRVWVVK